MTMWHSAISRWSLAACLLLGSCAALAHKASDSYLQISAWEHGTEVRWDIALRDLDVALDLDANEDGSLTYGEVKQAWPRIESYALPRLGIDGCVLRSTGRALERRNDGAYAVLQLRSRCVLPASPTISYSLLSEVDPTHRGIAKIQHAGQPALLMMLDPNERPFVPAPIIASSLNYTGVPVTKRAAGFLAEGARHILTGYDHVLFLISLLLPAVMRRDAQGWHPVETLTKAIWPVVRIVSAFTVAHSLTLALAATGTVLLSPSFIEPAIAVTIILAALDNLRPIFPARRTIVAFCFGLIHGFGFANVLAELGLPVLQFVKALLQFNIGLELGQLLIVVTVTALLFALRRRSHYSRWVISGGSLAAISLASVWLIERTAHISIASLAANAMAR